jgi:hypothetical protein
MIIISTKATSAQVQARLDLRQGSRTDRIDGVVRKQKHNRAAAKRAYRKEVW